MRQLIEWRRAHVSTIREMATDVRKLTFDVDGPVPAFDAGSHLNIRVSIKGAPAIRTYTVVPSPEGTLAISVKKHPQSRGGSAFIWTLSEGDGVDLTLPNNRFELSWRASEYLLLAGGIGITPIYGMAKALSERGQPVTLHYGAEDRAAMAYADELEALLGENLHLYEARNREFMDLPTLFSALPEGGEVYVCGPLGMLEAVKAAWGKSGHPVTRLRYEVFGDNGKFSEEVFSVEVKNTGITVDVRPDQTLLSALRDAGVDMIYDCQRGECGLCEVGIEGATSEIDHRDVFFSAEEKAAGDRMCACVSRLVGGKAVVDTGYRK